MPNVTVFYLKDCPYCVKAKRAVRELLKEEPRFGAIEQTWIEERERPEIAERYDYYYVPSVYCGETKLYECDPAEGYGEIKSHIRDAFEAALAAE